MAEPATAPGAPLTPVEQAISPQTPDASTASPQTPAANAGGYSELISPKDFRVYRVPADKVKAYTDYGYVPSKGNNLDESQVQSSFDYWKEAGLGFVVSTVGNAPFVRTAVGKFGNKDQAEYLQQNLDWYAKEHPLLDVGANVLGTGLELAGAGALATAAAPAVFGTGAAAALGAFTGGGATSLGGAVAAGAATNVALGAVARMDDAAIHHAFEPAGQEKISWSLADSAKNVLQDAVLGAAIPGIGGVAGKTLGWLGKNMTSQAQKTLRAALLKERATEAIRTQGRYGDLLRKVDEVLQKAPSTAPGHVKAQLLKYEVEMNTIKRTLGPKAVLEPQDKQALRDEIKYLAGSNDQINSRISKWFKKDKDIDLHELQQMNKKISESIGWSDFDVNRGVNGKYLDIRERIKQSQQLLLQQHDASFGGTTASQWNESLKNYSDWSLLNDALNRRANAASFSTILNNVAANAAGGAVLGTVMNGGDIGAGLHGAMVGGGFGIIKNIRPAHYALASEKLGQLFKTYDGKLTRAVMGGLYGIPAQLHARTDDHPETLGPVLSTINADPPKAFTNIRDSMTQAGVPDVQADDAAQRHFAMATDVASLMPKRSAGADLPTRSLGDPMQQRKIQGLWRTAHDPTYALANPSKENIAFLQKHYPNVLANAQQACIQQLQQNPDLPYAAKQYCARLLGRPVGNSTSPNFFQMIQQARQQMAQAEQQGAQGGSNPSKPVSSSGDSSGSGTRLDTLQGGN
jgi:hypothetical protein